MESYSIDTKTYGRVNQDIVKFMFDNLLVSDCSDLQKAYYLQFFIEIITKDPVYFIHMKCSGIAIWQGLLRVARNYYQDELNETFSNQKELTSKQYVDFFCDRAMELSERASIKYYEHDGNLELFNFIGFLLDKTLNLILPGCAVYINFDF